MTAGTDITLAATTASSTIDFTTEGNYNQEDLSKTEFGNGSVTLQLTSGNYFGDASDGDVTISSNTELTVLNKDGSYNGDMVVKNYNSLTVNESVTLTTDQPGKGMLIYVKGDLTVNGTISMTARGAFVNPTTAGVSETGLRIIREKIGGTDTLSASDLAGSGMAATTAEANQGAISGDGTIFKVERMGAVGGTGGWQDPGQSGDYMSGGGGGGGGGGDGTQGTCFSGGSAGGGTAAGVLYGGQGGSCTDSGCGGGAGNPGGTGDYASGGNGTGGLLILIVGGNLTIGPDAYIETQGIVGAGSPGKAGGGSGGGPMIILLGGDWTDNGTVTAAGGPMSIGSISNEHSGAGGAGAIATSSITGITYPTTSYYITTTDDSQLDTSTWALVSSASITQTKPTDTDIKYLVSFDDRSTWKYWDGNSWETTTLSSLDTYGMSSATLEGLSSASWEVTGGFLAGTTNTIDFAMDLSTSDATVRPELDQIQLGYTYYQGSASSNSTTETTTANFDAGSDSSTEVLSDSVVLFGASCGDNIAISHTAGLVAPVTKSVIYGTVASSLTGSEKCWITQNLGADQQATSATDATEASAGWYWQFNRKQGFKYDGTTRTPSDVWITTIDEDTDWETDNDPCAIELGTGWRIPTRTEWENTDSEWDSYSDTYASALKIHADGYLNLSTGVLGYRGSRSGLWSGTQFSSTSGNNLYFTSSVSLRASFGKTSGWSIRCVNDSTGVISSTNYQTSGTFTSQIIDTTENNAYGVMSWNTTTPTNTAVTMKVRSCDDDACSGETAIASCDNITSGNDISSNSCVTDGDRYIQYYAALTTSDTSETPSLDDITINYTTIENGRLTSSIFNSESSANVLAGLVWTEDASLPTGATVSMYLRTAATSGGITSASWSEAITSGSSGCTKDSSTVTCTTTAIPAGLKDGVDDQYYQYRLGLDTTGANTATVDNIVAIYVVNGPPAFESVPTAAQGTDGVVDISYEIYDADTTDVNNVITNFVTPTFEYYDGSDWSNIASSSISYGAAPTSGEVTDDNDDGYLDNRVLEDSYLTYTATWIASTTIENLYTDSFQLRVTLDDKEAANGTVSSSTVAGILDTKAPTSSNVVVDATTVPATLTLIAYDDSAIQMKVSLDSNFTEVDWESFASSTTLALTEDPETVYVKFKDAYGNEATAVNATTPATPNSVVVQDISNINISPATYSLFATWGVVSAPSPGFASYKVYHSTNGVDYSLLSTVIDRTLNYYVHRFLTEDSVNQYKIYTVDSNGNQSYYTSALAGTANGVQDGSEGGGGVETTDPVISGTAPSNITTDSATITWTTDELSDSRVDYMTDTGADFSGSDYTGKVSMVTSHSIVLDNLTPDTTYYYQVKSTDINSNMATKVPGDNGFTFDTLAGPVISNVTTDTINNESSIITWDTTTAANSYVVYSTNADLTSSTQTGSTDTATSHSVTVSGLSSGTKYYYYVTSGTANDKNVILGEVAYYNFTTTQDNTVPVITFDDDSDVTNIGDTTATISWITSEIATSTLEYGLTDGYGTTEANTNYNTNHSFTLTGLTLGTDYYFRLKNTDTNSNTRTDDNAGVGYTFTTTDSSDVTAPNIITDPTASTIADTFAYISWVTDEASNSVVNYGTTSGSYTTTATSTTMDTTHSVKLDSLTEEVKYYYQVVSADVNSNATTSAETYFTTTEPLSEESLIVLREAVARAAGVASVVAPSSGGGGGASCPSYDRKKPVIGDVEVDVGARTVTVSWVTNEETNEGVRYGTGEEYGLESDSLNESKNHKIVLNNLHPSNTYFYKVISIDNSGNKAESPQYKFTTLSALAGVEKDTDAIREINETPIVTSSTVVTAQENLLKLATEKVNAVFSKMAGQVSVEKLEENLVSTTRTIEELSKYIPAPLMSSDPNMKVTSSSAVISWNTDKPANSLIELATEADYGLDKDKPYTETRGEAEELTTSHAVILYNLAPSTTYHYKLKSKSQVGPTAQSKDFMFTTNAEVPQITKWSIRDVSEHAATFVWETSVEASAEMEYTPYNQGELQKERMKTRTAPGISISHSIRVENLDGGAVYFVRLKSRTQSGEMITHTIPQFNNVDDVVPPQILQLRTESAVSSEGDKIQTIITWLTDEMATSQVFYQEGVSNREDYVVVTELRDDLVYRHTTVLGDLKPATVYRFHVQSVDSQGNLATSKDYTLLTPQKKRDVVEIIFSNFEKKFGWLEKLGI